ncbi:MAG: alpha/beta fold hydrolase [Wenzhouxiangella sp.]
MNEIELCRGSIAGLHRPGGGARVLALHGWLDNANSFRALVEVLEDCDLVAIDFPGHGHSQPRPPGTRYHFDDYVFDVVAVLDDLGWPRCHLLGHSLGGAVASVVAGAAPDQVRSVTLIEGLGPLSLPADRTAWGWRRAL